MSEQIYITENITEVSITSDNPTTIEINQTDNIIINDSGITMHPSMAQIQDVDLDPLPADGQVLTYDDISGMWQPENGVKRSNMLVVDIAGRGDYTTIKAACDQVATLTPGVNNQWVIQVQPGYYTEQPFAIPTYCLIKGMGQTPTGNVAHCVMISPVSPWVGGTFITLGSLAAIDNCGIAITLDATATADGIGLSGNGRYTRCWFQGVNSTAGVRNLKVIAGGVVLQECVVSVTGSNSTAVHCSDGSGIKYCWLYSSVAGTAIYAVVMTMANDDTNVSFVRFGANTGNFFNTDIKCDDGRVWALNSNYLTSTGDVRITDNAPLDKLSDVTITTPADNDLLQYDSVSGLWNNASLQNSGLLKLDQTTPQQGIGQFDINVKRSKTLVVDALGRGDYTTIKAACDYVATLTPGSTNQWVIEVLPGTYAEAAFTIPTYCLVRGLGQTPTGNVAHCVKITPVAPWTGGTFITMGSLAAIDNCGVELILDATATADGIGMSGTGRYTRLWVQGTNNASATRHLDLISGAITIHGSVLGSTSNNTNMIKTTGASVIKYCHISGPGSVGTTCNAIVATSGNTTVFFVRFGAAAGSNFNYDIQVTGGAVYVNNAPYKSATGAITHIDKWATSVSGLQEAVAATDVVSTLKGATGQTANLLEVKDSADAVLMSISAAGDLSFATDLGIRWAGGSKLYEQASPNRMLYQPNGDRFEVLNEGGNAFIAGFHGASSATNNRIIFYNGLVIGDGSYLTTAPPTLGAIIKGKVGVGTVSPASPLHIVTEAAEGTPTIASTVTAVFQRNASAGSNAEISIIAGTTGVASVAFGDKDAVTPGLLSFNNTSNAFYFYTNGAGTPGIFISNSNNVGINHISPLQKLDVNGNATADRMILKLNPAGATDAVPREWVESRTQNLITNGSGLMGDNYNFSGFTFDVIETHGGGGSFARYGAGLTVYSDELIPVDVQKYYRLILWGKSGNVNGTEYEAVNKQYAGICAYDADGNAIAPEHSLKYPGSVETTLAVALNPGDTTITLTDATGWNNGSTGTRRMVWWPYTNLKGYAYPNHTYTRNVSAHILWDAGAITGNVITLKVPWAGAALPVNTPVRNAHDTGSFKYIALGGGAVPNTWTRYEGYIGGLQPVYPESNIQFPMGTQYVKLLFLNNYTGPVGFNNRIRWSDIVFTEMSSWNLEGAIANKPGIVTTGAQVMGAGNKYFSHRISVGQVSTGGMLDVKPESIGTVCIISRGLAGQTGNLFEARNSSNAILAYIDAAGIVKAVGYKSSDNSAGLTQTVTVRNAAGDGTTVLTFKNGLLTGVV